MSAAPAAGDRLGDYELVERVGEGGFGQVWRATDLHRSTVAVKILRPATATSPGSDRAWFTREYLTGSRVDSRFIATPIDADLAGDPPWIAFPFIEGRTLTQLIDAESLSPDRIARIAEQILRGLIHLHSQRLVHRDIKPANIMISPGDRVTILDLGVAHDPEGTRVTRLVQPGTPAYMAPEADGPTAGPGMDIWAFSVTVADMLDPHRRHAGMHPVDAARPVHPGWADAIRACQEQDPQRRPSAVQLRAWIADGTRPTAHITADGVAMRGLDRERAHQLLRMAADFGDLLAIRHLGRIAQRAGDLDSARRWWQRAADKDEPYAMVGLGWLAQQEGDLGSARSWYRRAADAGDRVAMRNLGVLAEQDGDLATARSWWQRAADAGEPHAMTGLGWLAERAGDLGAARVRYRQAADAGEPVAMRNLGWLAQQAGDIRTARSWWQRAADAGESGSMRNLGWLAQQAGDPGTARAW